MNAYFADLPAAPLFDPQRATSAGGGAELYRLPTAYNADVGLYVLNGCAPLAHATFLERADKSSGAVWSNQKRHQRAVASARVISPRSALHAGSA